MVKKNFTLLVGTVVLKTEKLRTIEMTGQTSSPYIEFEVVTDSAEFGGHVPCVAYGPTATNILAFGLAAGMRVDAHMEGWIRGNGPTSAVVVVQDITFLTDKDTIDIATQNVDLIHAGRRPVKRKAEGPKIQFRAGQSDPFATGPV